MTTFKDLGLAPDLLRALDADGYVTPTPIQAQAIPGVLAGRDLLGIAQTGTGKTAAFALPILQRLAASRRPAARKGCRVLVLSPTRELATQIADSFKSYGRHLGFSVATVFGGVGHRPQVQALQRGVDVLVATPGRLIDHIESRNAVLSGTEVLVLDEADQMLDLGFVKPIRRIVRELTAQRQNLFFSATMPQEIGALAAELLRNPLRVAVTPQATTVERIEQRVIHIETHKKRALLVELFADAAMQRTLVFTRTKRGADKVARHLESAGIAVAAIHGNKSQRQREEALEAFKAGHIRALAATDIAARGIDVDQVTHVVNFELPNVPESYVHRIGRTARAGAAGIAISLCDGEERSLLRDIERTTRQSIPSIDRRNDAALVADKAVAPSGRDQRDNPGRGDGRPRHADSRGRGRTGHGNRGRDRTPRHRNGHGDRDHADQRAPEGGIWTNDAAPADGGARRDRAPRNGEHGQGEQRPRDGRQADRRNDRPRSDDRRNGGAHAHRDSRRNNDQRDREQRHDRPQDARPHEPRRQLDGERRGEDRPSTSRQSNGHDHDRAPRANQRDQRPRQDRPHPGGGGERGISGGHQPRPAPRQRPHANGQG